MTDRPRDLDGLDPPEWVSGTPGGRRPGTAPRQGTVPPPRPPDPRFRPDRRRRPDPRHAPGLRDEGVDDPVALDHEVHVDDVPTEDADEADGADETLAGGHGHGGDTRAGRRAAERASRAQRKRHRRRNIAVLVVVLALLLPFLLVGGWFVYQLNPPGGPGDTVRIEIEEGWGVSEIADELQSRGVIGSALAFEIYANVRSAGPFADGPYELRTSLGVRDAVAELENGPLEAASADLELTLPPGLTLEQIAQRVGELPGRDTATFLQLAGSNQVRSRYQPPEVTSLEGMLFPDTYRIGNREGSEEDELAILQKLVAEFDERAAAAGIDSAPTTIGRTPYEAVVIASLIEREAGVEEDRSLISAVIRNRLNDGDLLQIDAAGCYGKGGCDDAPLTDADKESDSPYNTYRFPGLVPTPISTSGEASLRAAVAPADVPFKFYVLGDESGAHVYAETFEEHEANIAESRRRGLL